MRVRHMCSAWNPYNNLQRALQEFSCIRLKGGQTRFYEIALL
jgi:hypothetical protein